jgi:hypothetical protein
MLFKATITERLINLNYLSGEWYLVNARDAQMTPIMATEARGKTRNVRSSFRVFRVIPWLFITFGA